MNLAEIIALRFKNKSQENLYYVNHEIPINSRLRLKSSNIQKLIRNLSLFFSLKAL